jgi:hypothetical protein
MNHLDRKVKRELMKLIGGPSQDELDVDEILGLMLQISFALMMIFMIAFFLFRAKVGTELDQVQNIHNKQLISEQRQKLIVAQDKVENYFRTLYGLKQFAVVGDDMSIAYQAKGLINNGKLTENTLMRNAFINGSAAAFKDFSSPALLQQKWLEKIASLAGVKVDLLIKNNKSWLNQQVNIRIATIRNDCEAVQQQAAAEVQEYFVKHPQALKDIKVKELLQRFIHASSDERALIIPQLSMLLRKHVFEYLSQQTRTPMLETLK